MSAAWTNLADVTPLEVDVLSMQEVDGEPGIVIELREHPEHSIGHYGVVDVVYGRVATGRFFPKHMRAAAISYYAEILGVFPAEVEERIAEANAEVAS